MPFEVNFADEILKDYVTLGAVTAAGVKSGISYLVGYSNDTGNLSFNYGNLYTAVHLDIVQKNYTLSADETVQQNLGTIEGTNAVLTINGLENHDGSSNCRFSIIGTLVDGITVDNAQTLKVQNVNISGFKTALVANEGSMLNLSNVNMFGSSVADISNAGTLSVSGTNSVENIKNTGSASFSGKNTIITIVNSNTAEFSGENTIEFLLKCHPFPYTE